MSNEWKPAKPTVELRQSRIRREPPPPEKATIAGKSVPWRSSEWEIKLAIFGIVLFALAIDIVIIAVGVYWG